MRFHVVLAALLVFTSTVLGQARRQPMPSGELYFGGASHGIQLRRCRATQQGMRCEVRRVSIERDVRSGPCIRATSEWGLRRFRPMSDGWVHRARRLGCVFRTRLHRREGRWEYAVELRDGPRHDRCQLTPHSWAPSRYASGEPTAPESCRDANAAP